jgi:hypothetical protein
MTSAVQNVRACISVEVGMRVYYDCPRATWLHHSMHEFFERYAGKIGIVQGFPMEYVGPLDARGRMPGVYIVPGLINVKFESDEQVHTKLDINHFLFLDPIKPAKPTMDPCFERIQELPNRVVLYPDDVVRIKKNIKPTRIDCVEIRDDGVPTYFIRASTRKQVTSIGFTSTKDVALIEKGNVRHLYEEPDKLAFSSVDEEIMFWARKGISELVVLGTGTPRWEWSYDAAKKMVHDGEGDLIASVGKHRDLFLLQQHGDFMVFKLHECFGTFRNRVRRLSLKAERPPLIDDPFSAMNSQLEVAD